MRKESKITKIILITISVFFLFLMLVLPLISVIVRALGDGVSFYIKSIQTEYVLSALGVTLLATAVALVVNTCFGIAAACQ